ncbi:MAG: hypothetical protein COA91_07845 [Robiginitomaculum sp.]|nr:MAG: hypothetical protein COA91_07845 [Robiginitomaculum sp.]
MQFIMLDETGERGRTLRLLLANTLIWLIRVQRKCINCKVVNEKYMKEHYHLEIGSYSITLNRPGFAGGCLV